MSRAVGEPKPRTAPALAVRRARVPLLVLAAASLVAMVANAGMSRYELLAFGLGPSRLSPSSVASAPVRGWTLSEAATYPWATRYFGGSGTWTRYAYVATSTPSDSAPPAAVTVDVIGTVRPGDVLDLRARSLLRVSQLHPAADPDG